MGADAFSFISQEAVFEEKQTNQFDLNNGLLDRFLNESDLTKSLLLWLENAPNAPISWHKEQVAPYIQKVIAEIDALITKQLNMILHQTEFQKLEASWRNINWLVNQSEQFDKERKVKIRLLSCSWATLSRDVNKAMDFDQSAFFKLIYQSEFDKPGGEPFGVIIGDYQIANQISGGASELDTLKEISRTAAAAFAPFICSASPQIFGVDYFSELGNYFDIYKQFEQVDYIKWRSFREMEESRFIGMTAPRVLTRTPYQDDGTRFQGFKFQEKINNPNTDLLWGSAAYPFVATLIRAFCDCGWFGQIRGIEPGKQNKGLVTGLVYDPHATDIYQKEPKPPLDLLISSRTEKELSELGFIPACPVTNTEHIVFYSNASIQQSKQYDSAAANINARLSAMLQYILCVSRFAHYIKLLARDRVGSYATPQACERDLQAWVNKYTTASDASSEQLRSKYPLSNAKVKVSENKTNPGHYFSVLQLQPHFQLDQMVSSIKLVTELSPHQYS